MKKKILIAIGVVIVLSLIALVSLYRLAFRVMSLPGGSMANTIIPGESVAITKLYGEIKRGDIVLFYSPQAPQILLLKRVIGLPGETIEVRGTKVLINGQELPEKRVKIELPNGMDEENKPLKELADEGAGTYRVFYDVQTWDTGQSFDNGAKYAIASPYQIPPGQYFMLGDSRDNSLDSRFWGTVSHNAIAGKAYMIYGSALPERTFTRLK